jgi:hypothetical protein
VLKRSVRAVAAALLVVALAGVQMPAATGQIGGATGLLRIASISPWVDGAHPFSVTAQILNQTELTLENAAIIVFVYGRVGSRSQLDQALNGAPPTEAIGSFSQAIAGTIAPGEQRTITLEKPISALLGSIARTGVYPVQITLRDSHGQETASAAIPYFAAQPNDPLNVTWIVPIAAPTVRPVDGAYSQSAIDSLGMAELMQQLQAIAARPGANLTLAPSPSLLDTLADLADGFELLTPTGRQRVPPQNLAARNAAGLLDEFRLSAQAAGEVATVPYVPADLPTLVQRDMRTDALRQITLGRSIAEQILHRPPSLSILVPANLAFDEASASALAPLGITGVVIDPATLPQKPAEPFEPGLFGPSRPVALGDGSPRALLPDAQTTARLAGPEQGILLAQAIIAETASSYLELPSFGAERAFVIDSPVRMAPTALAAMIDGLTSAPWVRMRSATETLTVLPPEGANLPFPSFTRNDTSYLAAARAGRAALSTLDAILVQPLATGDEFDKNILAAESSEWGADPAAGARVARRVRSSVLGILSGIQVGSGRRVTLTAKSGSVPVTVINKNPFPVRLRVSVDSAKVGFPSGAAQLAQVNPPNETVDFTVLARAAGSFPLDVRLETPDGDRLIARGSVTLRSSAVSTVALLVVAGSTLFLLLAWGRRSRRRRKATARTPVSSPPANTA